MAYTSSFAAASSAALGHDSPFIPIVAMRVTPNSRARSIAPSSHKSRWQWVSTIDAREQWLDPADAGGPARAEARQAAARLAECLEQRLGGIRDPRVEQERDDAQPLRQRVENPVEALGIRLVLGQLPGLFRGDVGVELADALPDGLERAGDVDPVDSSSDLIRHAGQRVEQRKRSRRRADRTVAVALDHRQR